MKIESWGKQNRDFDVDVRNRITTSLALTIALVTSHSARAYATINKYKQKIVKC